MVGPGALALTAATALGGIYINSKGITHAGDPVTLASIPMSYTAQDGHRYSCEYDIQALSEDLPPDGYARPNRTRMRSANRSTPNGRECW